MHYWHLQLHAAAPMTYHRRGCVYSLTRVTLYLTILQGVVYILLKLAALLFNLATQLTGSTLSFHRLISRDLAYLLLHFASSFIHLALQRIFLALSAQVFVCRVIAIHMIFLLFECYTNKAKPLECIPLQKDTQASSMNTLAAGEAYTQQ